MHLMRRFGFGESGGKGFGFVIHNSFFFFFFFLYKWQAIFFGGSMSIETRGYFIFSPLHIGYGTF